MKKRNLRMIVWVTLITFCIFTLLVVTALWLWGDGNLTMAVVHAIPVCVVISLVVFGALLLTVRFVRRDTETFDEMNLNEKLRKKQLMFLDVTEKEKTEKMRREFTANVSHELKTPLHTISGYAELMANGMVQPADIPQFSDRIHTETKRMIALVEDIIKLSHLDEGVHDTDWEEVDLYTLAEHAVDHLTETAQKAGVRLILNGEPSPIKGIPYLLSGIIFNLCDNAIKYNKKDGTVNVFVHSTPTNAVLIVKDTGIGIPDEQQERIFERFYRVDKSRSKEVGGTGLGLSIVKHSAKLHGATVDLHSKLGEGTAITVTFLK